MRWAMRTVRAPGARRLTAAPAPATLRRGFSLVELMVALILLSITLTALAGMAFAVSKYQVRTAGRAYEVGLAAKEVDRAVAAPIESLAAKLGQTTLDTPVTQPWPLERLISVSGRADSLTVRVSIRPIKSSQRADSLYQTVLRTR